MLLALNTTQFDKRYIMFSDKTKNNILPGDFYRVYYTDPCVTTNGLFVAFSLKNVKIEKYFNKIKCSFDKVSNRKIITFIKHLERNILEISPVIKTKYPTYRIEEQLNQFYIKIFSDGECPILTNKVDNINILLKISGIWSDSYNYGITFRFFFDT